MLVSAVWTRALWTVGAVLLQTQAATFVSGLWPGEGRPSFSARGTALALRATPDGTAAVASRLAVARGAAVAFDETRVRTVRPGRIVPLVAGTLRGSDFGSVVFLSSDEYYADHPVQDVRFEPGVAIEYLQDRAEGSCLVRLAGRVIEAESCPSFDEGRFRLESRPTTEWWIRVVSGGHPAGWLRVDSATVRLGRREF